MEFYAFNLPLIQHNLSKCSRCVGGKIIQTGVEAPKNGYVYVYVSNESNNLVYFDNFVISHTRGPVLAENHYYPFGVTMAGISSQAALTMANKYKFNAGTELNEDLNVDYYETFFRNYDAQIGRFNGVDLLSEKTFSINPFSFASDNPIIFNDPTGLKSELPSFKTVSELINYILRFGIDDFPKGFTKYEFEAGGGVTGMLYDPFPKAGYNKKGEFGLRYRGTYEKANGTYGGFGNATTLNEVGLVSGFIKSSTLWTRYGEYKSYEGVNSVLDGLGISFSLTSMVALSRIEHGLKYAAITTNSFTAAKSFLNISNVVKGISQSLGAVNVVISGVQIVEDLEHGNDRAAVLHTADAAMGIIALVPGGHLIAAGWFVSRLFWDEEDFD